MHPCKFYLFSRRIIVLLDILILQDSINSFCLEDEKGFRLLSLCLSIKSSSYCCDVFLLYFQLSVLFRNCQCIVKHFSGALTFYEISAIFRPLCFMIINSLFSGVQCFFLPTEVCFSIK